MQQETLTLPSLSDEQQVEARLRQIFDLMSTGNWDALRDDNDDSVSFFDYGVGLRPVQWFGIDAVNEAIDMWKREEELGRHMVLTVDRLDTHVVGDCGFCAVEFSFTVSANGREVITVPARGTSVFRREGDRWLCMHWHGSTRAISTGKKIKMAVLAVLSTLISRFAG